MNPRLSTLNEVEAAIWEELQRSVRDRGHPWRTAVLATVDGDAADARTVVLREADAGTRQLRIYTDSRAGKVAQLQAHPAAMLVLWSSPLGWQLRCRLHCDIADDGIAVSSRWARIKLSPAAQDYLSPLAPGSALDAQTPALVHREYFAVITARVVSIDWMELHPDGHRRAQFDADGPARWLQP